MNLVVISQVVIGTRCVDIILKIKTNGWKDKKRYNYSMQKQKKMIKKKNQRYRSCYFGKVLHCPPLSEV